MNPSHDEGKQVIGSNNHKKEILIIPQRGASKNIPLSWNYSYEISRMRRK